MLATQVLWMWMAGARLVSTQFTNASPPKTLIILEAVLGFFHSLSHLAPVHYGLLIHSHRSLSARKTLVQDGSFW